MSSWGADHSHSDYADSRHGHDSSEIYGVASEHHDHDYAYRGHDHNVDEISGAANYDHDHGNAYSSQRDLDHLRDYLTEHDDQLDDRLTGVEQAGQMMGERFTAIEANAARLDLDITNLVLTLAGRIMEVSDRANRRSDRILELSTGIVESLEQARDNIMELRGRVVDLERDRAAMLHRLRLLDPAWAAELDQAAADEGEADELVDDNQHQAAELDPDRAHDVNPGGPPAATIGRLGVMLDSLDDQDPREP